MKRLLTFLTLLSVFIGVGWATTVTFTSSTDGGDATITKGGVTINCTQSSSSYFQCFKNQTMTISSNYTITGIEITCTASGTNKYGPGCFGTVSPGSYTYSGTKGTWSGSATEISFTATSNQVRMTQIVVTYESSACNEPTFSPAAGTYYEPQSVTLSCTTTGATIRYTTDGTDPTATTGTVYSGPISVSSTTTIKAIATASGSDPSSVASATYTINTPEIVTLPYSETFAGTFGDFYKRDVTGTNIWQTNSGYAKASGYIGGSNTASESWLISPYINMTDAASPQLTFSHAGNYFTNQANMESDVTLKVKKQSDTQWSDLTINTWPDVTGTWNFSKNTTSLASYAGEIIQIAFVYTSSTSRAGTWEIKNLTVEDTATPDYYLYGTFNNWNTQDPNYKFNLNNGTYSLTGADLPDGVRFKIAKVVNDQVTEIGASNGGNDYGINSGWHNNLPMNGADAYTIASGALTNFTLNTTNMTFDVSRDAQFFIKGDMNSWTREALTLGADGWTINKDFSAGQQFGFVNEWGSWYGGNKYWIYQANDMGNPLTIYSNDNFYMVDAGNYNLTVNTALTTLTVTSTAGDTYTLVTSANELNENDSYIIVSKENAIAMAGQRTQNNRAGLPITLTNEGNNAVINETIELFSLEQGNNGWYFKATKINSGYLYACSSTGNQLQTESEIDADGNALATISIDSSTGVATVVFQGTNTRNHMRFNPNSGNPIFSCYAETSSIQNPVYLYKKSSVTPPSDQVATPTFNPGSANSSNPYIVYGGKQQVAITCATEGATVYYTINGDEPTTSSIQYTGEPFDLTSTGGNVTVKAIAVKADMDDSEIATSYYRFTNPNPPTFNPASGTVHNDAFNVTISSEYEDAVIYYMLDPASAPTAAQMSESGTLYENPVNVSGEGSHTIYAMVVRNGIKSSVVNATYTITSGGQPSGDGDYVKVTTATDLTDGEYLIVYEMEGTPIENGIVFDGSRTSLDAVGNTLAEPVEINNYTIASSDAVDAAVFTITYMPIAQKYSIRSSSGYYIGKESYANGLDCDQATVHLNTIAFDGDGNAVITAEGECTLRYNKNNDQKRFRYYRSGQQPVALYKKVENPVDEPTEVTLAELCQNGVITEGENWYVISDKLIAVYADDVKGILWCKDQGNASIFSTSILDGQVDFLKDDPKAQNGRDWDQSNWIALHFSTPTATNNIGQLVNGAVNRYIKPGTVKGKLIDDVNYALRMDLDQLELVTQADDPDINPDYIPNVYCPANFMPDNLNIHGGIENGDGGYTGNPQINTQNYFFMNPKIQEICEVTYAQWDKINGYFTVPTSSGFDGAFYIGTGYNVIQSQNFTSSLQDEHIYRFKAIVQRSDKDNYGPKNVTTPATGITLYPIDLDPSEDGGSDITTAINTVETGNGEVKSVKYVNVAGVVSDAPFQGVNIVVTEYTDGTRTTSKMLRK